MIMPHFSADLLKHSLLVMKSSNRNAVSNTAEMLYIRFSHTDGFQFPGEFVKHPRFGGLFQDGQS